MSVNIDHPNNDISTDGGVKPTLGGGPVAAWAMDTSTGGVGVEDGANTWAKIATFTGDGIATSRTINKLIFESATVQTDRCYAEVVVNIYDSSLSTYGSIDVLNIIGTGLSHTSFKLVQTISGLGNPVELWVQKTTTDRRFSIIELPVEDINSNTTINYNNNAAWQSATPSGAVNITSDWAGSGAWTPAIAGTTIVGSGTYSIQAGHYQRNGSMVTATGRITWSAHTGTGNMIITGLPFVSASGQYAANQFMHANITGTGDLAGYVGPSTSSIQLYGVAFSSGLALIALDTAGDIILTITYRAA